MFNIVFEILELFFLSVQSIAFMLFPIAFYVLGIIKNLKEQSSIWWLLGLPSLIFIACGILLLKVVIARAKDLWKEIKEK